MCTTLNYLLIVRLSNTRSIGNSSPIALFIDVVYHVLELVVSKAQPYSQMYPRG